MSGYAHRHPVHNIFHVADEAAGAVRANEPRALSAAVMLIDNVRSRVARTSSP